MFKRLYALLFATALILSLTPQAVFASSCSSVGYTVEYVNGVSDTLVQAKENQQRLKFLLPKLHNGEPTEVLLAYNEQHIGGVGDVVQAVSQVLFNPISTYNLHVALRQIAQDDTTRKLLLVGHSQGALYANSMYEYLTSHGVPNRAVDIYAVATPANYVAGGGAYLNSYDDAVIVASRMLAKKLDAPEPLPGNYAMPGGVTFPDLLAGHRFRSYLDGASDRIVQDINSELDALRADPNPTFEGGCIPAPDLTTVDHIEKVAYAVVDPVANTTEAKVALAYHGTIAAATAAIGFVKIASSAVANMQFAVNAFFSNPKINPAVPENYEKNFQIVKSLYGSSLEKEDYEELNGVQGGAVALVPLPTQKIDVQLPAVPVPTSTTATTSPPLVLGFYLESSPGGAAPPQTSSTSSAGADEEASTTPDDPLPPGDQSDDEGTSTDNGEGTSTPLVPPPHQVSGVSDTFDTFNSAGWQTINGNPNVKNFDFDDGSDGECFHGGCIVGVLDAGFANKLLRTHLALPPVLDAGTFTIYGKIRNASVPLVAFISICSSTTNECPDGASLNFNRGVADEGWHQYYVAWRQGSVMIESCFMEDDIEPSHCVWQTSDIPTGAQFNGISLWTQSGYRNDLGTNVWFDELEAR
jgi:hypothetical protein